MSRPSSAARRLPRLIRQHAVVDLTSRGTVGVRASMGFAGPGVPVLSVARDVEILRLRVGGVPVEPELDASGALRLPAGAGATRLEVECTAPMRTDGHGVLARPDAVFTRFQPDGMRGLLPSVAPSGTAARFSWTLILPPDWIAYGPSRSRSELRGTNAHWRFSSPHPMPATSAGFAAGRWRTRSGVVRSIDGRELRVSANATPGLVADEVLDMVVAVALGAVRRLERWVGAPLPVEVWDQVFVPSHPTGALETTGCPSFDEALLLDADVHRLRLLVVHELVHAWFGTLVTPRGWEDLWFAEGSASYLAERCLDELDQGADNWARFDLGPRVACAAVAATPFAHPVRPAAIAGAPADQYDELSYTGAALLLERWEHEWPAGALRRVLGDAAAGGAHTIDLEGWVRLAARHVPPLLVQRMRQQLTAPWTSALARPPVGVRSRPSSRLAARWIDVGDGVGLVVDAVDATIDAVVGGSIPDAAVPIVATLAERHLGGPGAPPGLIEARRALRCALEVRATAASAHGCLHAWMDLAEPADAGPIADAVARDGRACCTAALRDRMAGWDAGAPDIDALWDLLDVGHPPLELVPTAATAQRRLDVAGAEEFAERYLRAVGGFASRLSRLEAAFAVRTLYPWSADPARLARRAAHAAVTAPAPEVAVLAWVAGTAARAVAARQGATA